MQYIKPKESVTIVLTTLWNNFSGFITVSKNVRHLSQLFLCHGKSTSSNFTNIVVLYPGDIKKKVE